MLIHYIAWAFIFIGLFFILSTILGLYRLSDLFSKIHAVSLTESIGIPSCYIGIMILKWNDPIFFKILILLILILIIAPTNTHAFSKFLYINKKEKDKHAN